MTAPTLTSQTGSTWDDTTGSSETTGTLTWNSGDRILVVGFTEDNSLTLTTPTATGLTFTALGSAIAQSGACWMHAWTATAGSSGSSAVATTHSSGATAGIHALAFGGCTGFVRTDGANITGTQTVSVTRTQANSLIVFASGDWSASSSTGLGWTPAGQTQLQAATTVNAGAYAAYWGDQGSTGTTSYGTTGLPGTAFAKFAVEVLGTAGSSTTASATEAVGAGAAQTSLAVAAANGDQPAGTGTANGPLAAVVVNADVATGSAAAYGAAVSSATTESLFTGETPAFADQSDGTPGITTAVNLKFSTAGTVDVRWYCTTSTGGTWTGLVWRKTNSDPDTGGGALVASNTFSGTPTGGAWNVISVSAAVNATDYYTVGVHNDQGRYVATTSFTGYGTGQGGITSAGGHVHAVDNGTAFPGGGAMYQGLFIISASPAYPATSGNGSNYFVDVVFTPAAGGTASATEAIGAGAADLPTAVVTALPDVAPGVGSADNVVTASSAAPPEATGAGAAQVPVPVAVALPAEGAGTGQAQTPSVAVSSNGTATPAEATGTGIAYFDAGSSISLDLIGDDSVYGTGAAYAATVSTSSAVSAQPAEAVGSGIAYGAAIAAATLPPEATGSGDATGQTAAVSATGLEATASGTAYGPTAVTSPAGTPTPTSADGAGAAFWDATAAIGVTTLADFAAAAGTALQPTVLALAVGIAPASDADGTGSALPPSVAAALNSGASAGSGQAFGAGVLIGGDGVVFAGTASGSGQACPPRVKKLIPQPFTGVTPRPYAGITQRP